MHVEAKLQARPLLPSKCLLTHGPIGLWHQRCSLIPQTNGLPQAGEGLAQSVEAGVKSMLDKGKDFVEAAKRSVGMESDRPAMSQEHMGAAGKMQHAPPGAEEG